MVVGVVGAFLLVGVAGAVVFLVGILNTFARYALAEEPGNMHWACVALVKTITASSNT